MASTVSGSADAIRRSPDLVVLADSILRRPPHKIWSFAQLSACLPELKLGGLGIAAHHVAPFL